MEFLIVFVGGGLGAMLRHGINTVAVRFAASGFPVGTFVINVTGSLIMGVVVELFALRLNLPQQLRLFLTTGILGGYTTFSTFSLEAGLLHERGHTAMAVGYVVGSVVLGIGALFLGMSLVRSMR